MSQERVLIPIPGELRSVATDQIVASADQIYDFSKNSTQENINQDIFSLFKDQEKTIPNDTLHEQVDGYLRRQSSQDVEINRYIYSRDDANRRLDQPLPIRLAVSGETLYLSQDYDAKAFAKFKDRYHIPSNGIVEIYNLIPGTRYFYQVDDGPIQSFLVQGLRRFINAGNIKNVRDLGGIPCNGGYIAYDKIFRGSELMDGKQLSENVTWEDVNILKKDLEIVMDLDLRRPDEIISGVHLSNNYYNFNFPQASHFPQLTQDEKITIGNTITTIINLVLGNVKVYVHCAWGYHRVGILCAILEGLLGASQTELEKDYELSSFSLVKNNLVKRTDYDWKTFMRVINTVYKGSWKEFVLDCGVDEEKIELFKSKMLINSVDDKNILPVNYISEVDGIYQIKDNVVYPLSHPDLSTQASILPQRFGNLNIYEVLIPLNSGTSQWEVDDYIPSGATILTCSIFSDNKLGIATMNKVDNKWNIILQYNQDENAKWMALVKYINEYGGNYYNSDNQSYNNSDTNTDISNNYLIFKVDTPRPRIGTSTVRSIGSIRLDVKSSSYTSLQISNDKMHWEEMEVGFSYNFSDNIQEYYVRGILSQNQSNIDYTHFTISDDVGIYGNCNSLWDYTNLNAPLKAYCGYRLFSECGISHAPSLPATTLATCCYSQMFQNCSNLRIAPELPATTLADSCYESMFKGCIKLTRIPTILPALELEGSCYYQMFFGCENITNAPILPAPIVLGYSYLQMFAYCSRLANVECYATDISAHECISDWLANVASTGIFKYVYPVSNWRLGTNVPNDWILEEIRV